MLGGRWLVPARHTPRLPTSATSVNPWRQLSGLSQGLLRRRPKGTQCGFPRPSTLFAVYYTPSFFCWSPCAWPLLCGVIRFCQFSLFLDVYCGFSTCVFLFLFIFCFSYLSDHLHDYTFQNIETSRPTIRVTMCLHYFPVLYPSCTM